MHTRTLLLAPWYFPLKVISWEAAIKLKYEGTADVVVEYDDEVSSPSVTWKVPAVMRLRKVPGSLKKGVKFSRQNVYMRDGYRCQYCTKKLPPHLLTYDHVTPKSHGGRRDWENIVTACGPCNLKKGNKTCDESGMFPRTLPYRPKSLPLTGPVLNVEEAPEEWRAFLPAT
jgi:5-methylcytosine-specific restriction endonuclease McrA